MLILAMLAACKNTDDVSFSSSSADRGPGGGGSGASEDSGGADDDNAGEDSGTEAVDTGGCDQTQLILKLEARGSDGTAAEALSYWDAITVAVTHRNPCTDDIVFSTPTSCLVPEWSLTVGGRTTPVDVNCTEAQTTWRVDPNSVLDAKATASALDRGVYLLSATPSVSGQKLTTTFTIQ